MRSKIKRIESIESSCRILKKKTVNNGQSVSRVTRKMSSLGANWDPANLRVSCLKAVELYVLGSWTSAILHSICIYKIQDEGAGLVVCNKTKLMSNMSCDLLVVWNHTTIGQHNGKTASILWHCDILWQSNPMPARQASRCICMWTTGRMCRPEFA